MTAINALPFAHRQQGALEYWFEEPRDLAELILELPEGASDASVRVFYMRSSWPELRWEVYAAAQTGDLGWLAQDDWYNCQWQEAKVIYSPSEGKLLLTFGPLAEELPEGPKGYSPTFRRTLGFRVEAPDGAKVVAARLALPEASLGLRLWLPQSARGEPASELLTGYNCEVEQASWAADDALDVTLRHFLPPSPWSHDEPLLTVRVGQEVFTVNALTVPEEGMWLPAFGAAVTRAETAATLASTKAACKPGASLVDRIEQLPEQTLPRALKRMTPPDSTYCFVGLKHNRAKYALNEYGDLFVIEKFNKAVPASDTPRLKWEGRQLGFFFGLHRYQLLERGFEQGWLPVYRAHWEGNGYEIAQAALTVPVTAPLDGADLPGDAFSVALMRFEFLAGKEPAKVRLPISLRENAQFRDTATCWRDPAEGIAPLGYEEGTLWSDFDGKSVLRALIAASDGVEFRLVGGALVAEASLAPGKSAWLELKVPFGEPTADESLLIDRMTFAGQLPLVRDYWAKEIAKQAPLRTPDAVLDTWYKAQLVHVYLSDDRMPDSDLVNCVVGTEAYGNFTNEATMIVNSLERRGLHAEARRRIEVWLEYQSTVPQPGNFSDHEGLFYGAGGYEQGAYNQHHGWALWCMGEHWFFTGDTDWLRKNATKITAGCDWIIRQRQHTKKLDEAGAPVLEYGFLPAGSLEDVTDFYYWLSTNSLTWRGLDTAARALREAGHPEGMRLTSEADAYAEDLRRGFTAMRRRSPVVKLRDSSWAPHIPSRLYRRGRDVGWIREVLEGAIYLLISGLFPVDGPEAEWILRDYEDTRYVESPWSYDIEPFEHYWFDRGGFSMQPNLLAGCVPFLMRDQVKHYLRGFFNAFASCWRPEECLLIEHPLPVLGLTSGSHYKPSDEANSLNWLLNLLVFEQGETLYYGKALPRYWLREQEEASVGKLTTKWGATSVAYHSEAASGKLLASITLPDRKLPEQILVRFRHPQEALMTSVTVDGIPWVSFDAKREWVELDPAAFEPGRQVTIVAKYE